MSGVACDALNPACCPHPRELVACGANGARLVMFDDDRFFTYADLLLEAQLPLAVVLARESCANDDFGGWASWYAQNTNATYYILGNEEDAGLLPEPSPSSWKMTVEEYARFWAQAAPPILAHHPSARCVVGALVSGQPSYLEELLPLLDPRPYSVSIHPYGRDAAGAAELFDLYRSLPATAARTRLRAYGEVLRASGYAERRLLVTEWNRPAHEIGEYEQMLREETEWACWFCWSDGCVDSYGLVTADQQPKAELHAFTEAQNVPEVNDAIQKTMQEFEAAGGHVGTVYTVTDREGVQIANTDAGLFVSQQGVPGAQILLDARAKNPFR